MACNALTERVTLLPLTKIDGGVRSVSVLFAAGIVAGALRKQYGTLLYIAIKHEREDAAYETAESSSSSVLIRYHSWLYFVRRTALTTGRESRGESVAAVPELSVTVTSDCGPDSSEQPDQETDPNKDENAGEEPDTT